VSGTIQRIDPPSSSVAAPFWDATRGQQLVLPWCASCDAPFFYPREVCPRCLGAQIQWRPASGRGTVYAVTVEHRPQNPMMAAMAPYAVALVQLDEGVRLLSNIVTDEPLDVRVGQPVRVTWEALSDGRHLPLFEPVAG
jgi:uncharacterized OB-fold protein